MTTWVTPGPSGFRMFLDSLIRYQKERESAQQERLETARQRRAARQDAKQKPTEVDPELLARHVKEVRHADGSCPICLEKLSGG
eukprot:CAMPEP_0172060332 /NCGR_PEP_ID=MMETSP1043-20130122/7899_1 /TAXON_ID=464988 /ORGANISM="Hemiselmis andersenii, Strain CCMP441" /LENGTH=83 /DNA_ID=CAMNT_0012720073 /DNA_START=28 /DNA_END=276 /DNA_ORIENTATION=-